MSTETGTPIFPRCTPKSFNPVVQQTKLTFLDGHDSHTVPGKSETCIGLFTIVGIYCSKTFILIHSSNDLGSRTPTGGPSCLSETGLTCEVNRRQYSPQNSFFLFRQGFNKWFLNVILLHSITIRHIKRNTVFTVIVLLLHTPSINPCFSVFC